MAGPRDLKIEEMEEQLRREMPLLDVPESLSADRVAAVLKEKKTRRKTPVYVWVRSAVAAAVILAIGIGAWSVIGGILGGGKKEAYDENFAVQETESESYGSVSEDGYDGTDSFSQDTNAPVMPSNESAVQSGEPGQEIYYKGLQMIQIAPGEEIVIDTDIPFDGTEVECRPQKEETKAAEDICEIRLTETEKGYAAVELKAKSPGQFSLDLVRNAGTEYHLDITVKDN